MKNTARILLFLTCFGLSATSVRATALASVGRGVASVVVGACIGACIGGVSPFFGSSESAPAQNLPKTQQKRSEEAAFFDVGLLSIAAADLGLTIFIRAFNGALVGGVLGLVYACHTGRLQR